MFLYRDLSKSLTMLATKRFVQFYLYSVHTYPVYCSTTKADFVVFYDDSADFA